VNVVRRGAHPAGKGVGALHHEVRFAHAYAVPLSGTKLSKAAIELASELCSRSNDPLEIMWGVARDSFAILIAVASRRHVAIHDRNDVVP
jgi:hypothetical protein